MYQQSFKYICWAQFRKPTKGCWTVKKISRRKRFQWDKMFCSLDHVIQERKLTTWINFRIYVECQQFVRVYVFIFFLICHTVSIPLKQSGIALRNVKSNIILFTNQKKLQSMLDEKTFLRAAVRVLKCRFSITFFPLP